MLSYVKLKHLPSQKFKTRKIEIQLFQSGSVNAGTILEDAIIAKNGRHTLLFDFSLAHCRVLSEICKIEIRHIYIYIFF